jgi:hypothetical protein
MKGFGGAPDEVAGGALGDAEEAGAAEVCASAADARNGALKSAPSKIQVFIPL